MSRVVIYPYTMDSSSSKELQIALAGQGIKCIRVYEDGNYRPRATDLIVNWGTPRAPDWNYHEDGGFLNLPESVHCASNKLTTMLEFAERGIRQPQFTESSSEAMEQVSGGSRVLGRRLLNSSGGKGIVEFSLRDNPALLPEDFEGIPLFTKYIPKVAEYRIHVFNEQVIDIQRKRRSREALANEEVNPRIRNHSNGWVFIRENYAPDSSVLAIAISAVDVLGLDFGAVDIIVDKHAIPYVLEVNTAPGLEGATINSYVTAILQVITRA